MDSNVTIMYALPRSMTQWWRWFFSHGCHSVHDPLARCTHPRGILQVVEAAEGERVFIADTGAIYFHEHLQKLLPGHRRIYMLRNPVDCKDSIERQLGRSVDLREQHERLMRHAYGADNNVRLHYGTDYDLPGLAGMVTGKTFGNPLMLQVRVDTPLRGQYRDRNKIKSLLAYKDPL